MITTSALEFRDALPEGGALIGLDLENVRTIARLWSDRASGVLEVQQAPGTKGTAYLNVTSVDASIKP